MAKETKAKKKEKKRQKIFDDGVSRMQGLQKNIFSIIVTFLSYKT